MEISDRCGEPLEGGELNYLNSLTFLIKKCLDTKEDGELFALAGLSDPYGIWLNEL